jgi:glutaredoxin
MSDNDHTRPKSTQYRRDLQDKPPIAAKVTTLDDTSISAKLKSPLFMTIAIIIALIACIYIFSVAKEKSDSRKLTTLFTLMQKRSSFVQVNGVVNDPSTMQMVELLRMHGIGSTIVDDGVATEVSVTLGSGKTLDYKKVIAALINIPVTIFHVGYPSSVVLLYGVAGCPYAQRARDMLTAKNIPFQYVDLNSGDPAMTFLNARLLSSGLQKSTNPYLEMNGKMYDLNSIYDAINSVKR